MNKSFSSKEFEHKLWMAAHIITGPIDASDYKTYIFPILFFKRINDVYDEEFDQAMKIYNDQNLAISSEQHRIQIPNGSRWSDVISVSENIGKKLQDSFRNIEKLNQNLYGIFGDAPWTNKDRLPDELIKELLNHFHKIPMGIKDVLEDDMGRAYEYLIKKFADKANKKAGEFYTPRNIVRLMVKLLEPKKGESIYDPACGTGGMLLETINHIKEIGSDPRLLKIKGQEKNLTTEAIARMNLFLHGMEDFEIKKGDTLRNPKFLLGDKLETFDCVIANPPFSLEDWGYDSWLGDKYKRNDFGLAPKKNGDFAWIMHMYKSMKENSGRMAIVIPNGVLSRGGVESKLRKALIQDLSIKCIIGLADNLFYGTGIPACILLLSKNNYQKKSSHILFINAQEIYIKNRSQNTISQSQCDEIYDIYRSNFIGKDKYKSKSRFVEINEIEQNNFDLNIARYIKKDINTDFLTIEESIKYCKDNFNQIEKIEEKLENLLKEGNLY